jgi:prepilin-type N-terminal cleavage/methylation domain-containing protein
LKARRSNLGFTLVEVSLAIAIAAVALVSVVSLVPVGYDANRKSLDATRTTQLAEDVTAALRAIAQASPNCAAFQSTLANGLQIPLPAHVQAWKTGGTLSVGGSWQAVTYSPAGATLTDLDGYELACRVSLQSARVTAGDSTSGLYARRARVEVWPNANPDAIALSPTAPVIMETLLFCPSLANVTPTPP